MAGPHHINISSGCASSGQSRADVSRHGVVTATGARLFGTGTAIALVGGTTTTVFSALGTTDHDGSVSTVPVPEPTNAWLLLGLGAMTRLTAFRGKAQPAGSVRG